MLHTQPTPFSNICHDSSSPLNANQHIMTFGSLYSYVSELYTNAFPPAATFSLDQIPDLSGQVILVTGGNTGIGKDTAKVRLLDSSCPPRALKILQTLLERNAKVYIACRNQQKMEDAIADLERETGKRAHSLQLDLASLKSIKKAAAEFRTSVAICARPCGVSLKHHTQERNPASCAVQQRRHHATAN